jgi:hypothetical protein
LVSIRSPATTGMDEKISLFRKRGSPYHFDLNGPFIGAIFLQSSWHEKTAYSIWL